MTPTKILYVDDEAMSLKYFERLINPMAPVLTALSVQEGKVILQEHHAEIAVLVSDQRMPGAAGNELLQYARENYPHIVRMLTTAYSELGEAIGAINDGEIYRYITKPWDLENLRADLKNALELAALRSERDSLLGEKMSVQEKKLLAQRVTHLAVICAGFVPNGAAGLCTFLDGVCTTGCVVPRIDWRLIDHAQLMQLEARRSIHIGRALAQWQRDFGTSSTNKSPADMLAVLAQALPQQVQSQGQTLLITKRELLTWVLDAPPQEAVTPEHVAWLAWLLWCQQAVQLSQVNGGWQVCLNGPLPKEACLEEGLAQRIEHVSQIAGAA